MIPKAHVPPRPQGRVGIVGDARMDDRGQGPVMYVTRMDAVLNRWFTSYEEARASLQSEGGYLDQSAQAGDGVPER